MCIFVPINIHTYARLFLTRSLSLSLSLRLFGAAFVWMNLQGDLLVRCGDLCVGWVLGQRQKKRVSGCQGHEETRERTPR